MKKRILTFCIAVLSGGIFVTGQTTQVPNAGFEEWTDSGNYTTPTGWYSLDEIYLDFNGTATISKIPGRLGGNAVKIKPSDFAGLGSTPGLLSYHGPLTARPVALNLYYKSILTGSPLDTMVVTLALRTAGQTQSMASCQEMILVAQPEWTFLSIPINYTSTVNPDSIDIIFLSGRNDPLGTEFHIDDVSLFYNNVNIGENKAQGGINVYPNPAKDAIYIVLPEEGTIEIYNALGTRIETLRPQGTTATINTSGYADGVYFFRTEKGITQRFIIQN